MTRLSDLLTNDKEKLLQDLREAGTPDRAQGILLKECDDLLLRYREAEEERRPVGENGAQSIRAAEALLEAVKLTAPLADSIGETKLFELRKTKEELRAEKLKKTGFSVLLAAGILLAVLAVVLYAASGSHVQPESEGMLRTIGMLSASLLCLLGAGIMLSKFSAPSADDRERRIENIIDAEKYYGTLLSAVIAIDHDLEEISGT